MNNVTYIEPFTLRDLYTVSGQPGLWRIKNVLRMLGIAVMYKLTEPSKITRIKFGNLSQIDSTRVPVIHVERIHPIDGFVDPRMITLAIIFERMYDLSQHSTINFDPVQFDRLHTTDQHTIMLAVVPSADMRKFMPVQFSKILRWYADLELSLTMLEPVEEIYE